MPKTDVSVLLEDLVQKINALVRDCQLPCALCDDYLADVIIDFLDIEYKELTGQNET